MAYTTHAISSLQEVVQLWAAFAADCGWIVDNSDPTAPSIKHPTYPSAMPMRLRYADVSAYGKRLVVDSNHPDMTGTAVTGAPVLNPTASTGGVSVSTPTKVHFIGTASGTPYLATIVEFGFNSYRHLYVGYMNKSSDYEGGEVISGTWSRETGSPTGSQVGWNAYETGATGLFSATAANDTNSRRGGVRVLHPNNPTKWREFRATGSGSDFNSYANGTSEITVMGGYLDGANTGYAIAGKSEYTVSAVVSPIPLLVTTTIGGNRYFRNIGSPAGVRHINIENFEPGSLVNVGSREFVVFPWMSKRASPIIQFPPSSVPSTSRFPQNESSGYLGYAYEVG